MMNFIKKYWPLAQKVLGGIFILGAFGGMQDLPEGIPMSLFMILVGVLLIFPSLVRDRIPQENLKTTGYWGAVFLGFVAMGLSAELIPKTPYLTILKNENLEWQEDHSRYYTENKDITLSFIPNHPEDAQRFYIEDTEVSADEIRIEYPLSLSEKENVINIISEDKKDRRTTQTVTIFYNSPEMIAQAEKEEAERKAEEKRIAREKAIQDEAEKIIREEEAKKRAEELKKQKEIAAAEREKENAQYKQSQDYKRCRSMYSSATVSFCKSEIEKGTGIGGSVVAVVAKRGIYSSKDFSNYGSGNNYQYCWWNGYTPSCYYTESDGVTIKSYN